MKNIGPVLIFVAMIGIGNWSRISDKLFRSKEDQAITMANQLIWENLKSPSTASVVKAEIIYQTESKEQDFYIIKSTVDAQNSFGAVMRNNYCVAIKHNKNEEAEFFRYNKHSYLQNCDDNEGRLPASLAIDIMKSLNDFP